MNKKFNPQALLKDQLSLENNIVVISGGGGFLGLYFAEAVAEFGAIPLLLDINKIGIDKNLNALQKNNYTAFGFECDISDSANIDLIVSNIIEKYKKVDVLINATNFVGINPSNFKDDKNQYFANFENYSEDLWEQSIKLNLTGTFLLTQKIGRFMVKKENGSIINISSDVGVISPDHRIYNPDPQNNYKGVNFNTPLSYSVSKAGIIHMTRYLATYWAEKGIRVNAISPAGVNNNHSEEFTKKLTNLIPLGRMASPQELKGPIVFLASNASSFITGSNLIVDGGRTIW
jgi:NAD(P)-dependent dehydrogenase (short-subunit alcohol dehydrogenase family)